MRLPRLVKAPLNCPDYFTAGKIYQVDGHIGEYDEQYGHAFYIIADDGYREQVRQKDTSDPDYEQWLIVELE